MKPLRLLTCGDVDDGKSTLIGRLLVDSGALLDDQLQEAGGNLAHFTDGLKAEREQGITIDVAHRYFHTARRKFVLLDSPGHFHYTRNMVSAASQADVALLLIDTGRGLTEQTLRHAKIANLLGVEKLFVIINKLDLFDWSEKVFERLKNEFIVSTGKSKDFTIPCQFVPISALTGANVVHPSPNLSWHKGAPLLQLLEEHKSTSSTKNHFFSFSIQNSIQNSETLANSHLCFGTVASGKVSSGDEVFILPGRSRGRVRRMYHQLREVQSASSGQAIAMEIDQTPHQFEIARGQWLTALNGIFQTAHSTKAKLIWFKSERTSAQKEWLLRHGHREIQCRITESENDSENESETDSEAESETDSETDFRTKPVTEPAIGSITEPVAESETKHKANELSLQFEMNDIAKVKIEFSEELVVESYKLNKFLGSAILIDPQSLETVAAALFMPE